MFLAFVFSPIGRWLVILLVCSVAAGVFVHKIRSDAVSGVEAKSLTNTLERVDNAIRAGDALPPDPDRVRGDKYCRDC